MKNKSLFRVLIVMALGLIGAALFSCGDTGSTPGNETCDPNTFRCSPTNPNERQVCDRDGNWVFSKDCSAEGKICTDGVCVIPGTDGDSVDGDQTNTCNPGETRCGDTVVVEVCQADGTWKPLMDCSQFGSSCQNGKCLVCPVGTTRCNPDDPNVMQKCIMAGDDSSWTDVLDCSTMGEGITCVNGMCRNTADGDTDGDTSGFEMPEGESCTQDDDCNNPDLYCFIPEEEQDGVCIPYCEPNDTNTCPLGYFCDNQTFKCKRIEGFCTSSHQCNPGEFCAKEEGFGYGVCKRYCYQPGESCPAGTKCCLPNSTDADCVGHEGECVSTQGQCTSCYSDADCGNMFYCEKVAGQNIGCCRPKCTSNDECPNGLVCRDDGRCAAGVENCDCGGGCPAGYICDQIYCQCVLNCPACGPMECCDANSAPNCYTCECVNPTVCGILLEQCCFGYHCSAIVYGVLGYCI